MSPESNGNGAAAFPGYWFKMPDDIGPLMELGHMELKVWMVIARACQRDRGKGRISLRQIQDRADSGSLRYTREAVDVVCNPRFAYHFIRYRPGTEFKLTKPEEWRGRAGVEYRLNLQFKQKDAGECIPPVTHSRGETAETAECVTTGTGKCVTTVIQKYREMCHYGDTTLRVLSELRAGAPQNSEESAFGFGVVSEASGYKLTSPAESQTARFAPEATGCRSSPSAQKPNAKADPPAKPAGEHQNLSDEERQEQRPVPTWKQWTTAELGTVRQRIAAFWGRWPSEGFELDVMYRAHAGGGAVSAAEVLSLLDRKWKRTDLRPGGRHAPHSQNWFLELVAEEFYGAHMPEAAAADGERRPTLADELADGIATIEIPDAEPVDFDTEVWQKLRAKTSAPPVPRRAPAAPATKPEAAAPDVSALELADAKPAESLPSAQPPVVQPAVRRPPAIVSKPPGITPERRAEIKAMLDAAEREYRASKPPSPMPPGSESGGGLDMAAGGFL